MLLVIDTGNTNTTLGVFDGAELVAHWRLTTALVRTVDEYGVYARNLFEFAGIDYKAITAVVIASVVPPLNYTLKRMAEVYFHLTPLMIDHTTEMGLEILYNPPSDVGADRLPFGHHVALGWQRLKSGPVDAFKQRSSRAFAFAERPMIQALQQFLNRLIKLGNCEELAMPERG